MCQIFTHPHSNTIPDINDRTPNDPAVLIDSRYVHYFMNRETPYSKEESAERYVKLAEKQGWKATAMGTSVLLVANVTLGTHSER